MSSGTLEAVITVHTELFNTGLYDEICALLIKRKETGQKSTIKRVEFDKKYQF